MRKSMRLLLGALVLATASCAPAREMPAGLPEPVTGRGSSTPLHFEVHGAGRPLIALHGFGGSLYTWRHLKEPLARDRRLILFDLKGFGASPKPYDDDYSMLAQADLIYQYIVAEDLRGVVLMGHSMGGGVALMLALKLQEREPGRLAGLILIDSAAYPQNFPGFVQILRTPVIGSLVLYLAPDRVKVRSILKQCFFDDGKITEEDVAAYAAPLGMPGGKYALQQTARQILPAHLEEITARYPSLSVPALIIWGEQDEILPMEHGRHLARALPNSRLVILPECGHNPMEEKPRETLREMRQFLEGLEGKKGP